jgi:hypothetical protein
VYLKIGLDPDVLPQRHQVIEVARRHLETIESCPSLVVEDEDSILHDRLSTFTNEISDFNQFEVVAETGISGLMGELSPYFDWNDWNSLV